MNRIIIIGNGFDLAHKLNTRYKDFIDNYWTTFYDYLFGGDHRWMKGSNGEPSLIEYKEDDFVRIELHGGANIEGQIPEVVGDSPYCKLCRDMQLNIDRDDRAFRLIFKNNFFKNITQKLSLENWVDVEDEYYKELVRFSLLTESQDGSKKVIELNKNFKAVKNLLEEYLSKVVEETTPLHQIPIKVAVDSLIDIDDVALSKQTLFLDSILTEIDQFGDGPEFSAEIGSDPSYGLYSEKEASRQHVRYKLQKPYFKKSYCSPNRTLFLNFNYTKTAEGLYVEDSSNHEIINIHGELNNPENPIIFGYGDESDENYLRIENLQENAFLENMKPIQYHETMNQRNLLSFIQTQPYQVFIMGHSCGNSDRTLLNTIFEHDNCLSIKVFFKQEQDGLNNHSELVKNISRKFNDKSKRHDIVVNRRRCTPLVPIG